MKKHIFAALFLTALPFHAANAACTITPEGIGGVKLGQTLAQVKRAFPHMKVRSESDAEGVEMWRLPVAPNAVVYAHVEEGRRGRIDFLETFSAACQTQDGVHPAMRLTQVAQKWGNLKNITMSEIEMRQFAQFARQPARIGLRVEGGDFGTQAADVELPLSTSKASSGAKVLSIQIAR
ncbi:MAG: hypothetical protein ACFN26_06680 [Kingella denitrificans]